MLLLLVLLFAAYFFYQRRQTAQKNKALVRFIDQMTPEQAPTAAEPVVTKASADDPKKPQTSPDLFQRFTAIINGNPTIADGAFPEGVTVEYGEAH
jgi:hypothetical protein